MTRPEDILAECGPMTSSELIRRLVVSGVSREAARQRIARSKPDVARLQGLRLRNRQSFLYLAAQFRTPAFFESLSRALMESGSAYGNVMRGLIARGGAVRSELSPIATGLPVRPTKGHIVHENAVRGLTDIKLIAEVPIGTVSYLSLNTTSAPDTRVVACEFIEQLVLGSVREWLVRLNLGSMNTLKVRAVGESLPEMGQYAFDLTGPSYIASLRDKNSRHGFIIADSILGKEVSEQDIKPFLKKVEGLYGQRRKHRLQPVFIADSFSSAALNDLRSRGVILASPANVFGPHAGIEIRALIDSLANLIARLSSEPDDLMSLLERYSKVEGAALNLRGVVLELVVAYMYETRGDRTEIRRKIRTQLGEAEIDVEVDRRTELVCCECKGKVAGNLVDIPEIQSWLDVAVPRIKEWFKQNPHRTGRLRFEFYSGTGYTDGARELIGETQAKHKKQRISFFDGGDIIASLKQEGMAAVARFFEEQFKERR